MNSRAVIREQARIARHPNTPYCGFAKNFQGDWSLLKKPKHRDLVAVVMIVTSIAPAQSAQLFPYARCIFCTHVQPCGCSTLSITAAAGHRSFLLAMAYAVIAMLAILVMPMLQDAIYATLNRIMILEFLTVVHLHITFASATRHRSSNDAL